MNEHSTAYDSAAAHGSEIGAEKAPWHPPTLEEIDYSATEAAGVGEVYDFTIFSGSV